LIGSVEVGKLADLVLWHPQWFGTKPDCVLKSGTVVWAQMGDANGSIPTPQPYFGRPMFGAEPSAACHNSLTFVSQAALDAGIKQRLGLRKRVEAVCGCRTVRKSDMRWNDCQPAITVDPETYQVTVNGEECSIAPAKTVSQSRQYYIF
jgi:urease alpha subunit